MNLKTKVKIALWILSCSLAIVSVEVAAQLAFRLSKKEWYWVARKTANRDMVQAHPYLAASLTPNFTAERNGVRISHNSFGCRGPEFQVPKPSGKIRIACLGGSTTYCAAVSDDQTWEADLQKQLGSNFEVINMGIPGSCSTESSIQTALLFSDVQPDVAFFYLGWNDARAQHVDGLRPDWSNVQGISAMSFALSGRELRERTATGYFLRRLAFQSFFPGMDWGLAEKKLRSTPDAFTDRIDQRAIGQYARNLRNIIDLCHRQRVTPIFIPQILNWSILTNDTTNGYLPFVRERDLKTVISAYNRTMQAVAAEENIEFVSAMMDKDFVTTDFVDDGHFSVTGCQKFSNVLLEHLSKHKHLAAVTPSPRVP